MAGWHSGRLDPSKDGALQGEAINFVCVSEQGAPGVLEKLCSKKESFVLAVL